MITSFYIDGLLIHFQDPVAVVVGQHKHQSAITHTCLQSHTRLQSHTHLQSHTQNSIANYAQSLHIYIYIQTQTAPRRVNAWMTHFQMI